MGIIGAETWTSHPMDPALCLDRSLFRLEYFLDNIVPRVEKKPDEGLLTPGEFSGKLAGMIKLDKSTRLSVLVTLFEEAALLPFR